MLEFRIKDSDNYSTRAKLNCYLLSGGKFSNDVCDYNNAFRQRSLIIYSIYMCIYMYIYIYTHIFSLKL